MSSSSRPARRRPGSVAVQATLGFALGPKLALFLAGVFILKLVVVLQLADHPLLQPDAGLDTTAYVELAKQVLAVHVGLGPGLYYVSPLYIYFLAAVYGASGSFVAVRIVQIALGVVSIALIFFTAREWFGTRAAWFAATLIALTGLVTFYEALILQAAIDPVLTAAALWLLTVALTRNDRRWYLLAGLAFGIQALNRPNVLLAALGIGACLVMTRRLRPALLLTIGLMAGLSPVGIRNVVVSHQWSLLSSHGGLNFYIGNSASATGYFHTIPGISATIDGQETDSRRVVEKALGRRVTDAEVSSYFSRLAWTWIREHPAEWARLLIRKTGAVFNAQHISLPFSYPFYAYDTRTLLRFLVVGPWLLVPLGLVGLVFAAPKRARRDYWVWLTFVPAYAVAVAIFFVSERYRLPLLVPLAIGAGAGLSELATSLRAGRTRRLAAAGLAVIVLAIAANWRLGLDDGRSEERIRMAERMASRGQVDEAERWASLALATSPFPQLVHYRVGVQYINSQRWDRAIDHLSQAQQLDPGAVRVDYALGQALSSSGRPQAAIPHLRRAIDDAADLNLAGYDLAVALQETGDLDGAARALGAVVPSPSDDVDVWLRLGRLAAEVRAPEVAEPFFRHAVGMRPDLASAHVQYGLDLLVLGQFEGARRELGAAIQSDPRDPDALAHLALSEVHLGRLSEARSHVDAALRLDPAHQVALQVLSVLTRGK